MIAIVDDDPSVRKALSRLVRSAGFSDLTFVSAEEFLDSDCIDQLEILLLDVHLPGMQGPALQREVKRIHPQLPVIFITAFENKKVREQALANGAVAFLQKPVDSESLRTLIQDHAATPHDTTDKAD